MIKRIESGIAGKGLGFDCMSSIKDRAVGLNLSGIVFLKDDGSVKIVAEGEEKNLMQFTKKLKNRGFFSTVENFYVVWHQSTREFKNFSVGYNK